MKRKFFKGLYCMAAMLLAGGVGCLIPSLKGDASLGADTSTRVVQAFADESVSEAPTQAKTEIPTEADVVVSGGNNWVSKFGNADTLASTSLNVNTENGYYQIKSADDLAFLSYMVMVGNPTYVSGKYELTQDIDLSSSLWTPIGNSTTTFKGVFNGNKHTIKSIRLIDESIYNGASGVAGLFGACGSAIIYDLTVGDVVNNSSVATNNFGVLAGKTTGAYIINCYNTAGGNGIGTVDSTTKIYRGGSRDGKTAHYTTESAIAGTLTVGSGSASAQGYAVQYNLNGGAAYKYTSKTALGTAVGNYGYLVNSSGTYVAAPNIPNYGAQLHSRAYAMNAEGGAFVVKEGFSFSSSGLVSGYLCNFTWATKNYKVVVDYGYGDPTKRTDWKNCGNDMSIEDVKALFNLTRTGYTLAGLYMDAGFTIPLPNFMGDGYGSVAYGSVPSYNRAVTESDAASYTIYTKWTANNYTSSNIKLRASGTDKFVVDNAISNFSVIDNGTSVEYKGTKTNIVNNTINEETVPVSNDYDYSATAQHNGANTITISFTLNLGYGFVGNGTTGRDVTTSLPANAEAGVYPVFQNGYYDTYNPTKYTVTRTNGAATGTYNYTITLDYVVGHGDIFLVFSRQDIALKIDGENVNWNITMNGQAVAVENGYANVKVQSHLIIKATAEQENDMYVVTYYATGLKEWDASTLKGTPMDRPEDLINGHQYHYGYRFEAYSLVANSEAPVICVRATTLTYNIDLSVEHDTYGGFESTDELASVAAKYNNAYADSTTASKTVTASLEGGYAYVSMLQNGYYRFNALTVTRYDYNEAGDEIESKTITFTVDESTNKDQGRRIFSFPLEIKDQTSAAARGYRYEVKFKAIAQVYSLNYEVYVDGELLFSNKDGFNSTSDNKGFFGEITVSPEGQYRPNDKATLTINKNLDLAKYLLIDQSEGNEPALVYGATEDLKPSKEDNFGDNVDTFADTFTVTFGAVDSTLVIKYVTKKANFVVDNTGYVTSLNGNDQYYGQKEDAVSGLVDTGYTSSGATASGKTVTYTMSSDVKNINIATGYYLAGWYLQNGKVVILSGGTSLSEIVNNSNVLALLANEGSEITEIIVQPVIKQKTITINFAEGEDEYGTVSVKDGSIATTETYYHEQEKLARYALDDDAESEALAALDINKAGLYQKIGYNGFNNWAWKDSDREFSSTGTFQYDAKWGDVYGGANALSVDFNPADWNKITYSVVITADKGSTTWSTFKVGDTITLLNNTYYLNYNSETKTWDAAFDASKVGNTASSFDYFSKDESKKANGTTIALTDANIASLLHGDFYYDNTATALTIDTKYTPNIYKFYISYVGYEIFKPEGAIEAEDGRYYVEVAYGDEASALANFDLTRPGYKIAKWVNKDNHNTIYAELVDDVLKYNVYAPTSVSVDGVTVVAIWTRDEAAYVTASVDETEYDVYYIGQDQTFATATLSSDFTKYGKSEGIEIVAGNTLENGDKVVKAYWANKNDLETPVCEGNILTLKNVKDSGTYVYVVVLQAGSSPLTDSTAEYKVLSDEVNVTIKKNQLVIKDEVLKTYYTGTSEFVAANGNDYGTVYFMYNADGSTDNTNAVTFGAELENSERFVITGDVFNIGSGYSARRYFVEDASLDNFTGWAGSDATGKYILRNNVTIDAHPIIINVSGKGFYTGMNHTANIDSIETSTVYDIINGKGYTFTAVVRTPDEAEGAPRPYDASELVLELKVTNAKGEDVTANFVATISGSYTIEEATTSNAYIYNVGVRYLTASNGTLNELALSYPDAHYILRVTNIYVGNTALTAADKWESGLSFFNYAVGGNTVLTLTGNGTAGLTIAVKQGENVKFDVQVEVMTANSKLNLLGILNSNGLDLANMLKTMTAKGSERLSGVEMTSPSAIYYAVFTDARAVTLDYNNDKSTASKVIYLSSSDETGVTETLPTWTGFEFTGWTCDSGLTATEISADGNVTGHSFTVADGIGMLTATANWTLLAPTTGEGKIITLTASETSQNITLDQILGSVTNYNGKISYTYILKKGATTLATVTDLTNGIYTFSSVTSATAGKDYSLTVKAVYGGETQETTVDFEIIVNLVDISSYSFDTTEYVYDNIDFASSITAKLMVGGQLKNFAIGANNGGITFKIENSARQVVTQIKNAGTYYITLQAEETIYTISATKELTITVSQAEYVFGVGSEEGVNYLTPVTFTKEFSSAETDADRQTTVTLKRGENVVVSFDRVPGEAVGEYPLTNPTSTNPNYTFRVVGNDSKFIITKTAAKLAVEIKNQLSMVYNGQTVDTVKATYDPATGWTLSVHAGAGEALASSPITLYSVKEVEGSKNYSQVTTNLDTALADFAFAIVSGKNVGSYALSVDVREGQTPSTYAGIEFFGGNTNFTITQATITVTSITKTFDEDTRFEWNSLATEQNTTLVVSGIAEGDDVTISGVLGGVTVGEWDVKNCNFTTTGESGNYKLGSYPNKATIEKSNVAVTIDATTKSFAYGTIKEGDTVAILKGLLGLTVTTENGALALANDYVTLSDTFTIVTADDKAVTYSNGDALYAGEYKVTFTFTSDNYQNANTTKTINITVTKGVIDLDGTKVEKPYDATTDLPKGLEWNMVGLVAGDDVTVTGSYASSEVGDVKLNVNLAGDDAVNYDLGKVPMGKITEKGFSFKTEHNMAFANDGNEKENPTSETFAVAYSSGESAATDFINAINAHKKTRTGYTQTGWTFDGGKLVDTANADALIQAAIAAGDDALLLTAVWVADDITITVKANNATIKNGSEVVTTVTIKYFESLTLDIACLEGYRVDGYTFTGAVYGNVTAPEKLNTTSITLNNVTEGGTLTINVVKIKINVTLDLSEAAAVANATTSWTDNAQSFDYDVTDFALPTVTTTANTYNFVNWTFGETEYTDQELLDMVKAFNGVEAITEDMSITFVAHFTPAPLTLNVTGANASVKVTDEDGQEISLTKNNVVYGQNVIVTVTGAEGWKFMGASLASGNATIVLVETGKTNATFNVNNITESTTITLDMQEIEITFSAESGIEDLVGTSLVSGWTGNVTIKYSEAKSGTLEDYFANFTVTDNTYEQKAWLVGGKEYAFTDNILTQLLGVTGVEGGSVIDADFTFDTALKPKWVGVTYTITFDGNDGTIEGSATTTVEFGKALTTPNATRTGYSLASWNNAQDGTGSETYKNGNVYKTVSDDRTLTLYAIWGVQRSGLEITYDSNVESVEYTISGAEGETGVTVEDTVVITINFKAGYEYNSYELVSGSLDADKGSAVFTKPNTLTIKGLVAEGGNIVINITSKASTYNFVVTTEDYEKVNGTNEFAIVFGQAYSTSLLENADVTRGGYELVGFTDGTTQYVTKTETGWTYVDDTYKVAGDTEVYPVWKRVASYYEVEIDATTDATYTGVEQTILNVLNMKVGGATTALDAELTNGDKIVRTYWVLVEDENKTFVCEGSELKLTNAGEGDYRFVIEFNDERTGEKFEVRSKADSHVTIAKANLSWTDANLTGYYTGSKVYSPTNAAQNGHAVVGSNAATDVTLVRFELVDDNGIYGVGQHNVRAYITLANGLDNYANVKGDGQTGYYIDLDTTKATIEASDITITVTGQGFYTGAAHKMAKENWKVSTAIAGLDLSKFDFSISLQTADGQVGINKVLTGEATFAAMLGENVATSNFKVTIVSEYEIVEAKEGEVTTTTLKVNDFTLAGITADAHGATLTIGNLTVGGSGVALGGADFFTHSDDSGIVFTISNNGSANITIVARAGEEIKFTVTVNGGTYTYLTYGVSDEITEEVLKTNLQTLTAIPTKAVANIVAGGEDYAFVVTNVKAIKVLNGDKDAEFSYVYAEIGGSAVDLANPTWKGFDFTGWTKADGIVTDKTAETIAVEAGANILPVSISASWTIAEIETTKSDVKFTPDASETEKVEITISDVIGTIENETTDLSYSYAFYRKAKVEGGEDVLLGNGNSIQIAANTDSDGDYYVVITASKAGYTNGTKQVNFSVEVKLISLTMTSNAKASYEYANKDLRDQITVTLTFNGDSETSVTKTLAEMIDADNIWFTGNEMKNVGSYTFTLGANEKIYSFTADTIETSVTKLVYALTADDVKDLFKYFGEKDTTVEVDGVKYLTTTISPLGEDITVYMTREEGETVGTYALTVEKHTLDTNYEINNNDNRTYEIKKVGGLVVEANGELTKVYNGKPTTIEPELVDGKWVLQAYEGASPVGDPVELTLSERTGSDTTKPLADDAVAKALEGVTFSIASALNAGKYEITISVSADAGYTSVAFKNATYYEITKAVIDVTSVVKEFDTSADFTWTSGTTNSVTLTQTGILAGEEVTISGQFADKHAGEDKVVTLNATLGGANAGNYQLKSETTTGQITAKAAIANVEINKTEFVYGEISEADLASILEKVGVKTFTLGTDDATENEYVSLDALLAYTEANLSSSRHLNVKAAGYTLTVTVVSTDYDIAVKTFTFTIKVTAKGISLGSDVITKEYDGKETLPSVEWNLSEVLAGDQVGVSGSYTNKENVTSEQPLDLNLTGTDKANYDIVAPQPTGKINPTTVILVANYNTETFVNDGQSIDNSHPQFEFAYPFSDTVTDIMTTLTPSTRGVGYEVIGWKYNGAEIDASSLTTVLKAAFDNGKTLTIDAVWKRGEVKVTINPSNAQITAPSGVTSEGHVYTLPYFTDATEFTVTGDSGYKLGSVTTTSGVVTDVIGGTRTGGAFTLSQVRTDATVEVVMEDIMVNVTINVNRPQYAKSITVEGETEEADDTLTVKVTYTQAKSAANSLLPVLTATSGTYKNATFTYVKGVAETELTTETLATLVGELDEDGAFTFTAKWVGEDYKLTLNLNEGEFTDGTTTKTINAVYGEELTFPEAVRDGKVCSWKTGDDVYSDGSVLTTVGTKNGSVYELTLVGEWHNRAYELTLEFGSDISVFVNNAKVESGSKYTLTYGDPAHQFVVVTNAGYGFTYSFTNASDIEAGGATVNGSTISVKNIINNTTMTIESVANENDITLQATNSTIESVTVDGVSTTIVDGVIKAHTGKTVVVTFVAGSGYSFSESDTSLTGSGSMTTVIVDGKAVVTLTGFTDAATITAKPGAKKNNVTVSGNNFDYVMVGGTRVNAQGGVVSGIETGSELSVTVVAKYGFKDITVNATGATATVSVAENFDDAEKVFKITYTITDFTGDFSLAFSAIAREYNFTIASEDDSMGTVTPESATVAFGGKINLRAVAKEGYQFAGWYVGDIRLDKTTTQNNFEFVLSETYKAALESDEEIVILAKFSLAKADMTISAGRFGDLAIETEYNSEIHASTVVADTQSTKSVNYGSQVRITINPYSGYEVDTIKLLGKGGNTLNNDDYLIEGGMIAFRFDIDSPHSISVTFKASEAVIKVQAGVSFNYNIKYGTTQGGTVYLTTDGVSADLTDSLYFKYDEADDDKIMGARYSVKSYTGGTLRFIVTRAEGYEFTFLSKTEGINITDAPVGSDGNSRVYTVTGYKGGDDIELQAIFTKKTNKIDVYFVDENNQRLPSGAIFVDQSGFVVANNNGFSNVEIFAVSGEDVNVDIYTNLNYEFWKKNGSVYNASSKITIDKYNDIADCKPLSDGYRQKISFTISNVVNDGTIEIFVAPKKYSVKFMSEGRQQGPTVENVTYGTPLPIQDMSRYLPAGRDEFLFKGYFTMELGQGNQYVDETGILTGNWMETGYTWNGAGYETAPHYEEGSHGNGTFYLYAAWHFSKAKISISFVPEGLKDEALINSITVTEIVTSLSSQTSWTTSEDLFYAEVRAGAEIVVSAYDFEGYIFQHWLVTYNGDEATQIMPTDKICRIPTQEGSVSIKAVYFAAFNLEAFDQGLGELNNGCGEVYIEQNSNRVDPKVGLNTKYAYTLVARAKYGYSFLGWINLLDNSVIDTPLSYTTIRDDAGNILYYEYKLAFAPTETPISYRAIFEGDPVDAIVDTSKLDGYGDILSVKVNGEEIVDYTSNFEIKYGDTIEIAIKTIYGYRIKWAGAPQFVSGDGVYRYVAKAADASQAPGGKLIIAITPEATAQEVTFFFDFTVDGRHDLEALQIAGHLSYREGGRVITIANGTKIVTLYGKPVDIDVSFMPNFKFGSIRVMIGGMEYDVSSIYVDVIKHINLTTDILSRYGSIYGEEYTATIIFDFARMLWTDEEYRSEELRGRGTSNDPYIIGSAQDLAFMAYAVNSGLVNSEGLRYADANYLVTADIKLGGKYWVPIGTKENPFNGIIGLGAHTIDGLLLYKTYIPNTSFGGLIWYMTSNAQIVQSTTSLALIIGLVCGGIALILLLILLIVLRRRRRRRKLEELANS